MHLVYRNNRSSFVPSAPLPKALSKAVLFAVYICQVVVLMLAVIGVLYLAEANTTDGSSAGVAVVEERPAPVDPITGFGYFPDQFVNQGTLPDEPIPQF